jgi:hypothetical protein
VQYDIYMSLGGKGLSEKVDLHLLNWIVYIPVVGIIPYLQLE